MPITGGDDVTGRRREEGEGAISACPYPHVWPLAMWRRGASTAWHC